MTTMISNQSGNTGLTSTALLPARTVHFDASPGARKGAQSERVRPQRRAHPKLSHCPKLPEHPKQPSAAESVYGFYLTHETALIIGRAMLPDFAAQDPDSRLLKSLGLLYSNAFCQEEFPTIPLKWRSGVLGIVIGVSRPLIVLGHRNTEDGDEEIYVNKEQLQTVQTYLRLGEQVPA